VQSVNRGVLSLLVFVLVTALFPVTSRAANNPVPLINSLLPTAVAPGSAAFTLTVEGANFTSGSVVNWNGSPRTTTFVNVTKVTAAITAADVAAQGTATVTVTSPTPGGGVWNQAFFSVVSPRSRIAFSSNNITNQVAVTSNVVEGDFNNDGKLDIAVAMGNIVYVLLGNGDGAFQRAIGTADPSGATLEGLYVADANNDGKLDIFATGTNGSTNVIVTFFGKGTGTFNAPVETSISSLSASYPGFVFADFNQDGLLDAAFPANPNEVAVLYGNTDGSFRTGTTTFINQYLIERALAAADFTGQGSLSLVVQLNDPTSTGDNLLGILTGTNGSFSPTAIPFTRVGGNFTEGVDVIVADFNGDGFPDIAASVSGAVSGFFAGSSYLQILVNTGNTTTPTFGSLYTVPGSSFQAQSTNASEHFLVAGDFNGDGKLDLGVDGIIFFGQGDGTFPSSFGSLTGVLDFMVAGDFNNDGKTDIIRLDPLTGVSPALGILSQIPSAPDFSGSVLPSTVNASLNNTSNVTVTLTPLSGFSSDVTFSVMGLPTGVTGVFTPSTVTGGNGSSTLAISVGPSVVLGTYTITITATGGGVTHSSSIPLLINSSPGDFTGSIIPDQQNITSGQSATFTITLSPTGGFTGNVALSLTGSLPSGATFSFSPATITGGSGSSTLTINTPSGLSANVYQPTITTTSGIISKSHTVFLGVTPSGGDFTGTYRPSQTSPPTGLVEYVFTLQSVNGYNQPVQITFSGLPAGAVSDAPISITPTTGGAAGGVHVTLTNVALGTYPLLVTLQGPGVIHQVVVQLIVN
jgi:hypothetical protein